MQSVVVDDALTVYIIMFGVNVNIGHEVINFKTLCPLIIDTYCNLQRNDRNIPVCIFILSSYVIDK
jgi:hypothetical protein